MQKRGQKWEKMPNLFSEDDVTEKWNSETVEIVI